MVRSAYFETVIDEVREDLDRIAVEEKDILPMAEHSIAVIRSALDRIRQFINDTPFTTEADEIHFFKVDKPLLGSKLIYFMKLYKIESRRPVGSYDLQLRHLNAELSEIDQSFTNYQEFYHYYRSGATLLDELYFIRGRQDIHLLMDAEWIYADPTFSTGYDLLISKLLANEDVLSYLNKAIHAVELGVADAEAEEFPVKDAKNGNGKKAFAQTPYRASEVYVFLKSLIDAQGVINHTYKSFFELTVPGIANMQQKSFLPSSLLKYSDKVDVETRENVKRLLQKMIRNIDNY